MMADDYWPNIPKQTLFGFGEPGTRPGDCWRCCIAAILNYSADNVPHFVELSIIQESNVRVITTDWLRFQGCRLLEGDCSEYVDPLPRIVCGPTIRSKQPGQHHCVVMRGGKVLYDPHPNESGLLVATDYFTIVRDL